MMRTTMFLCLLLLVSLRPLSAQHDHSHDMKHSAMSTHKMTMGKSGMTALKSRTGRDFDIAFLSQTIMHHRQGVQMAQQALKTAKTDMTKKEARMIISDQTKEIQKLTGWLKKWYGVSPSQTQMAKVSADNKAMMQMGVTSDRMFFEMMIPHHQQMLEMSKVALKNSRRAEVKKQAQEFIAKQGEEIARYKQHIQHLG
jgi:uncharacterized protein (DUF305 family)